MAGRDRGWVYARFLSYPFKGSAVAIVQGGLDLGLQDEPLQWVSDKWGMSISKFDLAAAGVAAVLVTSLALFFSRTRIGRALRAVADDHQAALAVGIAWLERPAGTAT